jgi:Concanavalin A-like lectin/glucanases superfamily
MGVSVGLNIITDGLIASIDPNNRKSTIWAAPKGLINTDAWASGQTSSVSGYSANETTSTENARVTATDPWGDTSVVWESRASGDGNGDGGWNTDWYYNIDRTKLYRFSVWMRRTSSTAGGTFYFGLYGTGGTWGVARLDNGTIEGNPYWECAGTGAYTQNQWYLYIGHCYPYGTTYTGRHPDSGYYLPDGTKYSWGGCNIGNDVKMLSDTTQLLHRTYHYYCGDSTTRLQFAYPRIDICDGSEPNLRELLNGKAKKVNNLVSSTYHFTMGRQGADVKNSSTSIIPKIYASDGTSSTVMTSSDFNLSSSTYTIIGISRYAGGASQRIISGLSNNWLMGHWGGTTENHYAEGWVSSVSAGPGDNNWRVYAATWNTSTDSASFFVNGVRTAGPNTAASAGPNNFSIGASQAIYELTNGEFACLYVYNRVLTDEEIVQVYNALRYKYNL